MSTPLSVHVFPTRGAFLLETKILAGSLSHRLVSRLFGSSSSCFPDGRALSGGPQDPGLRGPGCGEPLTWNLLPAPVWRVCGPSASRTMASKRQHAEVAHTNGSPPPKRSLRHDKSPGPSSARRGEQGPGKHKDGSRAASLRKADAAAQSPKPKALMSEKDWLFGPDRGSDGPPDAPFMDSVVKVYCVHTEPNFSLPWQKRRQYSSTGSGFMTSGRRLLTNAHCVEHHTQVKVKRRGDDTKFVATVLAIGTECDIALLTVEDPAFWEGPAPLKFGTLPRLQDAVTVVGYPIGGDTISVTSGVVSRIEVTSYVHGSSELLGVQIDAAINAGNSGGPAFNDKGQCVGIAFQSLKSPDAENIGYIIPTPVIFHFLSDYERNGRYTGFPSIGITWQKMESPALRASVGLQTGQKGVLVRRVEPTSQAHDVLLPGDVLMSFDGVPIANDGTVPFRSGERISFGFLVSQKFAGETADLCVLRERREQIVRVGMKVQKRLIPVHISGRLPSYYICAGLVFTPVVQPFLESEYGSDFEFETPVNLLYKMFHVMAKHDEEQVVALSQVLANEVNIGYEDATNTQVVKVNGVPVRNLRHLAHLADSCQEPFLRFDLENADVVVLDLAAARAATAEILQDHCIPADRSDDLRAPYKEPATDQEEPPTNGALALAAVETPLEGNVA